MTQSQWEGQHSFSPHPFTAASVGYAPEPPAPTFPSMDVVVSGPAEPAQRMLGSEPIRQRRRGHHPLVFAGIGLVLGAAVARFGAWLLCIELLRQGSLVAMAVGSVVFVTGRMIRLDVH